MLVIQEQAKGFASKIAGLYVIGAGIYMKKWGIIPGQSLDKRAEMIKSML